MADCATRMIAAHVSGPSMVLGEMNGATKPAAIVTPAPEIVAGAIAPLMDVGSCAHAAAALANTDIAGP